MRNVCPREKMRDNPGRLAASSPACARTVPVGWALLPCADKSPAVLWPQTEAATRKVGWRDRAQNPAWPIQTLYRAWHIAPATFLRIMFPGRCLGFAGSGGAF